MNRAQRNVAVLAGCQALLLTGNAILIALSPLVGFALAPDKAFATLPVTSYVVATALSTVPASLWMNRYFPDSIRIVANRRRSRPPMEGILLCGHSAAPI